MKNRIKDVKIFVFRAIFVSVAVLSPFQTNLADVVRNLYEAEVPVSGQSRAEREEVVREALKEVLVRISGLNDASTLAADEELVRKPSRFVQQFRYRRFKAKEVIPQALDDAKPFSQMLWLRFTKKTINKLLLNQGLSVWGKTRPSTLIWLVIDDQKNRVLIGNNTNHNGRTHLEEASKKRGLPVRLPLLDLADQSKLQITDVWGNFEDTILAASERYQTESVLVGRVYMNFAHTWHTRWTLYSAGQRQDWDFGSSESLSEAITQGIAKTGEILSEKFARVKATPESTANNMVVLQIKNISDLKTYNQTLKYLKGLSVVSKVSPYKINKEDVIFHVQSHSGRLGLSQAISLGRVLVKEPNQLVVAVETGIERQQPDLIYNMVP